MSTAGDFFGTLQLLADAGRPAPSPAFTSHVEQMWAYGAAGAGGGRRKMAIPLLFVLLLSAPPVPS